MRSQLRAALYLLSRSAYLKGAVVMTVLIAAFRIWVWFTASPEANVSFTSSTGGIFGKGPILESIAPFICCMVAAGMAGADRKAVAVRMACSTDQGRAHYAASRFVLVLVQTTAVCLLTVVMGLVVWAVTCLPVDSLDYRSPWIALWLLSSILMVATYAQVIQLLCWLTKSTAFSVFMAYLGMVLVQVFSQELVWRAGLYPDLAPLLEFFNLGTLIPSVRAVGATGAPNLLLLLAVPCVCLAITYALGQLFWAKRAV